MVTIIIIIITVIVSIFCFKDRGLFNKLSFNPYRIKHNKEWYRFITHGFVHADYTHLLINMFVFFSFGKWIEEAFSQIFAPSFRFVDTLAFLGVYIGGIVVASVYDYFKRGEDPLYISIGASGGVSAILFTSILLDPWGLIYFYFIPCPGIIMGIIYLVYCQIMAKKGRDNINHNAHFYGAIWGIVFPCILEPKLVSLFLGELMQKI